MQSKRLNIAIILSFLVASFFLLNVVGNKFLKAIEVDVTEQKIYTLSPGSQKIVDSLKEGVGIKLYFSKKLAKSYPYLGSYFSRVEELLSQYALYSKGKVFFDIIYLSEDSAYRLAAIKDGILGIPANDSGEELFFGLSMLGKEKQVNLPFIQPNKENSLEKEITSLILLSAGLDKEDDLLLALDDINSRDQYSRPFVRLQSIQEFSQNKFNVKLNELTAKVDKNNAYLAEIKEKKQAVKEMDNPLTKEEIALISNKLNEEEKMAKQDLLINTDALTAIKRKMKAESDQLEHNVKMLSTFIIPGLIVFFGCVFWLYQVRIASRYSKTLYRLVKGLE